MRSKLSTVIVAAVLAAFACSTDNTTTGSAAETTTSTASDTSTTTGIADNAAAYEGYNLLAPVTSTTTYLTDMDNSVVWSWESEYIPGLAAYLLEDGSLLRTGYVGNENFEIPGAGGIVQEIASDGEVTWEFTYSTENYLQHHDLEPLPNGNVLLIAWEMKDPDEAIAAGRSERNTAPGGVLADSVLEGLTAREYAQKAAEEAEVEVDAYRETGYVASPDEPTPDYAPKPGEVVASAEQAAPAPAEAAAPAAEEPPPADDTSQQESAAKKGSKPSKGKEDIPNAAEENGKGAAPVPTRKENDKTTSDQR